MESKGVVTLIDQYERYDEEEHTHEGNSTGNIELTEKTNKPVDYVDESSAGNSTVENTQFIPLCERLFFTNTIVDDVMKQLSHAWYFKQKSHPFEWL